MSAKGQAPDELDQHGVQRDSKGKVQCRRSHTRGVADAMTDLRPTLPVAEGDDQRITEIDRQ